MKLNFTFALKDLSGNPIEGENGKPTMANKLLAQMLSSQNKGNSIKLLDWALKVWDGKELDLDETDAEVLLTLIENTEMLTALAKVPMIKHIKAVKEKAAK